MASSGSPRHPALQTPDTRAGRMARPFIHFMHIESASGIVLVVCTAIALLAANTGLADAYNAFWNTHLVIGIDAFKLDYPLWYWVNDALMAIFFFVIGLEIKREVVAGELSDPRKVVLPVAAAVGGAVVPAGIYYALQGGTDAAAGWAIPMATDIAFVVGFLALLGKRVPYGLKIMLLTLAIVDDIMAVSVIALFYTETLKLAFLAAAVAGFALMWALNRLGVRTVPVYVAVGCIVWLCTLKSGIHPTVAGAFMGLMTPASAWLGRDSLADAFDAVRAKMRGEVDLGVHPEEALRRVAFAAKEGISPLGRLENALHPWVGFFIMPLFALANAAVPITGDSAGDPIGLSVAAGLVLGKPLGIVGISLLFVLLGWARLPAGVNWGAMTGGSCLAGIGFTMSIFIAGLSFGGETLVAAKTGVLLGSAISAVLGCVLLILTLKVPGRPQLSPPRPRPTP